MTSVDSALKIAQNLNSCSLDDDLDQSFDKDLTQNVITPEQALNNLVESSLAETGECLLDIGTDEAGESLQLSESQFEEYLSRLRIVANIYNACATLIYKRKTKLFGSECPANQVEEPFCYGHVLLRLKNVKVQDILESRVAVVGNVDAGKSTLLGVLTKDLLDDGRGKARVNLFKHKHEQESGRTSSVGSEIMGFDECGNIITPTTLGKIKIGWEDICASASKVLSFIDLAGHEKYLRTTVFGMTGCSPDYGILMIGANSGIIGMTKEHLGLSLALNVPIMVVITKIDMCPKNILESTIKQLVKILRSSGCRKIPIFINNIEDVLIATSSFVSERICPIFQVSNVTGENLPLLKLFLNLLPSNVSKKYVSSKPVEYQITDTFSVPGVGTVVNGTINSGIVHVGDSLLLGPDTQGNFNPTIVKSIQRKRINVPCANAGQTATFALKKTKRASIRKGMVLLSKSLKPVAVYEFEAEILILFHSSTINTRYQTMMHCGSVRQTAKIVSIGEHTVLRTGDRAIVRFRFMQYPEYLRIGTRLLFREGRTKGVGKIVRCITNEEIIQDEAIVPNASPAVTDVTVTEDGVDTIFERDDGARKQHKAHRKKI